ncbi:MAG: HD domain-containing phosphohydrolase [Candidatus Omnitrophota bacterium]
MATNDKILNAKILIIDDQQIHALLLEKIIKTAGYERVLSITDPRQAIRVLTDFQPDLVLLDLNMPGVDGFQIMNDLKEYRKEQYLPILVISMEKGQEIRLRALEAGATDFLSKPYENVEVLVRIRNMVEMRILDRQVREQNKILEARVLERTRELRDTRLDIIHRLARAAEYRDNDTGIHIIRMSRFCSKLGAVAGLSEAQCELLLTASPLHDIGKIGIPDHILLKPGKLTPEEWEVMKSHTIIGAELLSGSTSPLMKMAEVIAMTHHERWDGKGYPRGLKDEDIPLVGRICGICDVFDALTSKRPYKEAWSVDDTVAEIKKGSGQHFDPQLVEGLLKILPELLVIKNEFKE